jgi:gas vesicle protein
MSNDPDQIRQEIEATRVDLSDNVNALADSVRPGNVARRQVDKVKDGAVGLKDRIMGAGEDATSGVGDAVSGAKDAAGSAPAAVRSRTRGNPVAAGLVAFGIGWLVASLIPASSVEQQAATALKDKVQPLTDEVTQAAKQVASNLQEPVQQAVSDVKESAAQSVSTLKDEASTHAQSVTSTAQSAADEVKDQAGS